MAVSMCIILRRSPKYRLHSEYHVGALRKSLPAAHELTFLRLLKCLTRETGVLGRRGSVFTHRLYLGCAARAGFQERGESVTLKCRLFFVMFRLWLQLCSPAVAQ